MIDSRFLASVFFWSAVPGTVVTTAGNALEMTFGDEVVIDKATVSSFDSVRCREQFSNCVVKTDKGSFFVGLNSSLFGEGKEKIIGALEEHSGQLVTFVVKGQNILYENPSILSVKPSALIAK